MLVSAVQQCNSAIIIRTSPLSWASVSSHHPTLLGHHRAPDWAPCFFFLFVCLFFFGSLCFIATSHQLAILHTLLYVCQGYLCICPTLCFPNCVHQFVLCICIFIPSLQPGSSIQFSRFCIYELIYNICFFFSFWLTSLSITGSRLIHLTRTDSNSFFYITE